MNKKLYTPFVISLLCVSACNAYETTPEEPLSDTFQQIGETAANLFGRAKGGVTNLANTAKETVEGAAIGASVAFKTASAEAKAANAQRSYEEAQRTITNLENTIASLRQDNEILSTKVRIYEEHCNYFKTQLAQEVALRGQQNNTRELEALATRLQNDVLALNESIVHLQAQQVPATVIVDVNPAN